MPTPDAIVRFWISRCETGVLDPPTPYLRLQIGGHNRCVSLLTMFIAEGISLFDEEPGYGCNGNPMTASLSTRKWRIARHPPSGGVVSLGCSSRPE